MTGPDPVPDADPALRLGVVGAGSLGFHHVRIARDLPGSRSAGFYDRDPERADAVARELDALAAPSLAALLDRSDAVVVATPTSSHEDVAVQALDRGIHVFIEKPIAPDLAAADRILTAASRTGATVQVGHVERFNGAVLAARAHLDAPLFIESHRLAPFVPRSLDVAVVLDLMIHDVDLVRALVGRPVESLAATGVPVLTPTVDIANARLTFAGGAVANLTASRVSVERMRKLRIFQRSGYLSLDLATGTGEFLRLREPLPSLGGTRPLAAPGPAALANLVERVPIQGDGVEPLRRELESFVQSVQTGTAPLVTGEDGRQALEIALSIETLIHDHVAHSRTA